MSKPIYTDWLNRQYKKYVEGGSKDEDAFSLLDTMAEVHKQLSEMLSQFPKAINRDEGAAYLIIDTQRNEYALPIVFTISDSKLCRSASIALNTDEDYEQLITTLQALREADKITKLLADAKNSISEKTIKLWEKRNEDAQKAIAALQKS